MRSLFLLTFSIMFCSAAVAQEESTTPAAATADSDHSDTSDKPLDFWMKKKLDYSTGILRGLSMGDFAEIEANANKMRVLNKVEGFARSRFEGYRGHLRSFERMTDEVIRQAKKENIEGVTLAYHQLTVSCVRCHQSLRETE
ncbi:hypothetical protein K227x_04660 [Rubripirellula lacrimiformis]|uniref:Cytochrome C n=1 Tax=Rubripirellula lacrimiformis TaxID=1930273 RepID=A0A517N4M7_9BACT|nr:hypothetical protein [Rubripirellula lacrimiformis]QDT02095.1 hypothetical protein K227x_04660 [Rubripirellula lacrimiformis]